MSFWLLSLPGTLSFDTLGPLLSSHCMTPFQVFPIPHLPVGTLDTLMRMSERCANVEPIVEQTVHKIARAYNELHMDEESLRSGSSPSGASSGISYGTGSGTGTGTGSGSGSGSLSPNGSPMPQLTLDGKSTARHYITHFKWNETRYSKKMPPPNMVEQVVKETQQADDEVRKKQTEYAEVKTQLMAIERTEAGTLATKPLYAYLKDKKHEMLETEHLTTILVVVNKKNAQEFQNTYEKIDENQKREKINARQEKEETKQNEQNRTDETTHMKALPEYIRAVVPRSAKILVEENGDEFVLYRIVVYRSGAENIRNLLREKRYIVRTFNFDPDEERHAKELKIELMKKRKVLWSNLFRWTRTIWQELFVGWIHLKAVRLYVESVLRYGLPVSFKSILIEPAKGHEKKLRAILKKFCASSADGVMDVSPDDDHAAMEEEFYNYVYLPLRIDF